MKEMTQNLESTNDFDSGTRDHSSSTTLESAARTLKEKGNEVVRNLQYSATEAEHVLEETAETVRAKGNAAVNEVARVSGRASRYVRSHDTADVMNDLRRVARR